MVVHLLHPGLLALGDWGGSRKLYKDEQGDGFQEEKKDCGL